MVSGRLRSSVFQMNSLKGVRGLPSSPASVSASICLLALCWAQQSRALDWPPTRKHVAGMEKEKFLSGSGRGGSGVGGRRGEQMPNRQ